MPSVLADRVSTAITSGAEGLFALQRPDGSWLNRRPTAVLGTAGAILALHFADPDGSAALITGGVGWLLDTQNEDGGWGGVSGALSETVPTAIAMGTLHLLEPQQTQQAVRRALDLVEDRGGTAQLPDPTMVYMTGMALSLAGLQDAGRLRRIPLELLLLPAGLWRRRLSFRLPPFVALAIWQNREHPSGWVRRTMSRLARPQALRLLRRMEAGEGGNGGFGGDPWLTGLICLCLVRGGLGRHRLVTDAVSYLRSTVQPDGSWHAMAGLEVVGPAFAAWGLADAGYGADPRLVLAGDWFRSCQQDQPFSAFGCPPGGWNWAGPQGWPNVLDSAAVLALLARSADSADDGHLRRGVAWLTARQDRSGSWSTFVRDTTLPNDGPCPLITSHAMDVLLETGVSTDDTRITGALRWLLTRQRPDGTFESLWHRGGTPGTSSVLNVLARLGMAGHPAAHRARDWLLTTQLDDGSWGTGSSATGTAEETAWAVGALLALDADIPEESARAGVDWLLAAQRPDGLWDPSPVCMYIRDQVHYVDGMIVNGLALRALARYRAVASEGGRR